MKLFPSGHATHPQWPMAAGLVLAQLRGQMALPDYASAPSLGLLYMTNHYAPYAQEILAHLRAELPEVQDWAGTLAVGIVANNVEYIDEPALSVLLCDVPAQHYRVFSGVAPLGQTDGAGGDAQAPAFRAHTALVHASGDVPDLREVLVEMAGRTEAGYLFGGLSSMQVALSGRPGAAAPSGAGTGVLHGGLSGVAFGAEVPVLSRVTQGCQPLTAEQRITAADGNLILSLDGEPALDRLLSQLEVSLDVPEQAIAAVRATLVGLSSPGEGENWRTRHLGHDARVRHIIGLDPKRGGVAVADEVEVGMRLVWCRRNAQAAKADLRRICAEIREELEPEEQTLAVAQAMAAGEAEAAPHLARRIAGAVYVSCVGRGGAHFGAPNAELQLLRHALGDVPLTGFFAGGEIAGHHLYGYTGVLTVFTVD